jgi:hypothetical protein
MISELQVPVKVLQQRLVTRNCKTVLQVLVQWSQSPASLTTWKDCQTLRQRFPQAPAWGQVVSLGGGDVMTATAEAGDQVASDDANPVQVGQRSSRRARRPSVRVSGPEWSK